MLELAGLVKTIGDLVISLFTSRETNKRLLHDDFIKPIYESLLEFHSEKSAKVEVLLEEVGPGVLTWARWQALAQKYQHEVDQELEAFDQFKIRVSVLDQSDLLSPFIESVIAYVTLKDNIKPLMAEHDRRKARELADARARNNYTGVISDGIRQIKKINVQHFNNVVKEYELLKVKLLMPQRI